MMDTLGTNSAELNNASVEDVQNLVAAENESAVSEIVSENEDVVVASSSYSNLTKAQIVVQLENLVQTDDAPKREIDALKQAFYKLVKVEHEEKKKLFVDAGGVAEDFTTEPDSLEIMFKELLVGYREKRALALVEQEKEKEEMLNARLAIIEKLKELTNNPEDFNKAYNEFNHLQQEWKALNHKSTQVSNEIWRSYQLYVEKFYDLVKINNEFRDYDFKKNMEIKIALCEAVEKLGEENDVISAFHQMQKYQQDWKDSGPVAKELREEIWQRFRSACTVVSKRHQEHFDNIRSAENNNLDAKQALINEMEAIDFDKLDSNRDWEETTKLVIDIQERWKALGFAPKKMNTVIYERFRALCDDFFNKKGERYKKLKDDLQHNLEMKTALCEKAEALKDSTDWKAAGEVFVQLQKEWKTVGSIPRRYSEHIWRRFSSACDYFFEQRTAATAVQRAEETDNLTKKREIIARLKEFDAPVQNGGVGKLRQIIGEFNAVGHVPIRDKDKIYKEFRDLVDAHFSRLNVDEANRRLHSFKNSINDMSSERSMNKMYREREKLARSYEHMKSELQTCENNIGFFSVSSKGKENKPNSLLKELERKIEKLKEEIALTVKKIHVIDEKIQAE